MRNTIDRPDGLQIMALLFLPLVDSTSYNSLPHFQKETTCGLQTHHVDSIMILALERMTGRTARMSQWAGRLCLDNWGSGHSVAPRALIPYLP